MATATQKTFVCKITRQGETFTVTSPGGSKSLTFNASTARKAGVTLHQLDLISRLGSIASGNSLALTMIDMNELVKIRDKCKDDTGTHLCRVSLMGEVFNLSGPAVKEGQGFAASQARKVGVTQQERDLIEKLRPEKGKEYKNVELTTDEVKALESLCDKCSHAFDGCKPEDVGLTKEVLDNCRAALNGAAAEVAARTLNKTEAGVERREASRDSRGLRDAVDVAQAKVNRLNKMSTSKEAMNMLIYDIPQVLTAECPNPSGLLWNYGFRLNKSCWVLPQSSLEARSVQELLAHWQQYEIEVHIIPYAEHALERIRKIAGKKLHDEVVRQHTSFIEKLGSASDRLEEARKELDSKREQGEQVTSRDYEKLEASRDNQVRATIKSAAKALEAAINCARHFDEEQNLADLFQGLREAIRSERDSFNALMDQKNSKRSTVQI